MSTLRARQLQSIDSDLSISIEDLVKQAFSVENMTYLRSATAAIKISLQKKLEIDGLNIFEFGGAIDGETDDTASLQAAINSAAAGILGSSNPGGVVDVPAGICCITSGISVPEYVYIRGAGSRATEFRVTSSTGDVFDFQKGGYNGMMMCAIRSQSSRSSGSTIKVEGGRQGLYEDLYIQNQYIGINILSGVQTFLNRIEIMDCTPSTGTGIWVQGGNDTYFNHVVMDASGSVIPKYGMLISNTQSVWVTDCDILNAQYGVLINPGNNQFVTWPMFQNLACDQCDSAGFSIHPSGSGYVKGVFINSSWTSSSQRGIHCLNSDGATIQGVTITDHKALANTLDGVLFEAGTDIHINGGLYSGNSGGTNYIYPGIQFGPNLSQFSVIGSRSGAMMGYGSIQNYGIVIGSGCNNYRIIGNSLSGNSTSSLLDNSYSTSTNRVVADNLSYPTVITGSATLPAGATSVSVSHTFGITPESVTLTPIDTGAVNHWAGSVNSSTFTIYTDASSTSSRKFNYRLAIYAN